MATIDQKTFSPLERLAQQLGVLPRDRDWVSADLYHEELLDLVFAALQSQQNTGLTTLTASTREYDRHAT